MFKLYIVLTAIAALHVNLSSEGPERIEEILKSFIKNKCLTNGGSEAYEELKASAETFQMCFWEALSIFDGVKTEEEVLNVVCTDVRSKFHSCMVSVLDKLEPCLAKEEEYFPSFISGWYNSSFDEQCKNDAETLNDQLLNYRNFRCEALDEAFKDEVLEKCFSKSSVIKDLKSPDFVITKENLCGYLQHGNECLLNYLKENCDENVHKVVEHQLKPGEIWCDKYVNDV